jgi:hypothetical protein
MTILESTKLNHEVFKNIQITSQENMIVKSLEKFYEDGVSIQLFIPIVNSESKISIRLIDYFVTKYSKNHKINYKLKENDVEQTFNVHTSYKQQLKAFQKKHFDPFSRGDRIPYFISDNCVITTIGQLNFFKWFISKKVYNYVEDNYNIIEEDMNRKNKNEKTKIKITKEPKIKKIYKPNMTHGTTGTSTFSCINSNYRPISSTLTFGDAKTDKIIVSFTFN